MKAAGYTQKTLADAVGVSQASVSAWINGAACPGTPEFYKLSDILKVTMDYLYTGKHPVKKPKCDGAAYWGKTNQVPIVSLASAGEGHAYEDMGDDPENGEWIPSDCKDPNCYAVRVAGDSMEPVFRGGDVVVAMPNREARNGDVVVAKTRVDHKALLKKLRFTADGKSIRLISLNQDYEVLELERKEVRFLHPVYSVTRFQNNFFK